MVQPRPALLSVLMLAGAPALAGSITRPAPVTEHVRDRQSPGVRALGQHETILGVRAGARLGPDEQALDFTTRQGRSRVRIRIERSGGDRRLVLLSEEFQPRGSASVFLFVFDEAGRVMSQREIRPMGKSNHFKTIHTPFINGQAPPPEIAAKYSLYRTLRRHKGGFQVTIVDNQDKQHREGPKGRPAVSQVVSGAISDRPLPADPLHRAYLIAKMVDQADHDATRESWHAPGDTADGHKVVWDALKAEVAAHNERFASPAQR